MEGTISTAKSHAVRIRFAYHLRSDEIGRSSLYVLTNDLHSEPFGLLEDVHVDERYRSKRIASELVRAVIKRAQMEGCYKLIATSRDDGTREKVHAWYRRLGFEDYGTEFRMDFQK